MRAHPHPPSRCPRAERGSFLLEALIAALIVSLAILGLVGLVSRSIQNVDESKYRGEAAAIASSYVGQMWVDDRTPATLKANYESGGAKFNDLDTLAKARIPGALTPTVDIVAGETVNTSNVTVTLQWKLPGEAATHQYQIFAVVGANTN
jgi:type IV pilus assembly protein PilV